MRLGTAATTVRQEAQVGRGTELKSDSSSLEYPAVVGRIGTAGEAAVGASRFGTCPAAYSSAWIRESEGEERECQSGTLGGRRHAPGPPASSGSDGPSAEYTPSSHASRKDAGPSDHRYVRRDSIR